jgi:hypothetical protein
MQLIEDTYVVQGTRLKGDVAIEADTLVKIEAARPMEILTRQLKASVSYRQLTTEIRIKTRLWLAAYARAKRVRIK